MNIEDIADVPSYIRRNITNAWSAIEKGSYLRQAETTSKNRDGGLVVFKMKKEVEKIGDEKYNCIFMFVEKEQSFYNDLLNSIDERNKISSLYDPSTMMMVMVSVPWLEDTANEVRLYRYDTLERVF